jgi:Ca2+-binding EF-hand superfamily protein
VQDLLRASEKTQSKSVDLAEFMSLWKAFKSSVTTEGETEEEIRSAFRDYDIDGDGYITKDEMIQVRSLGTHL